MFRTVGPVALTGLGVDCSKYSVPALKVAQQIYSSIAVRPGPKVMMRVDHGKLRVEDGLVHLSQPSLIRTKLVLRPHVRAILLMRHSALLRLVRSAASCAGSHPGQQIDAA